MLGNSPGLDTALIGLTDPPKKMKRVQVAQVPITMKAIQGEF